MAPKIKNGKPNMNTVWKPSAMDENKKQRICAIYARVSTTEQHPENQVKLLKKYGSQQNFMV